MIALVATTWVLMGLVASRWTVGYFIQDNYKGSVDREKEFWGCVGIGLCTVLFGPLALACLVLVFIGCGIGFVLRRVGHSPIGAGMKKMLIYYYYLDRNKRKAALH